MIFVQRVTCALQVVNYHRNVSQEHTRIKKVKVHAKRVQRDSIVRQTPLTFPTNHVQLAITVQPEQHMPTNIHVLLGRTTQYSNRQTLRLVWNVTEANIVQRVVPSYQQEIAGEIESEITPPCPRKFLLLAKIITNLTKRDHNFTQVTSLL